jgi:AcrR family transcriptional regulator
MMGRDMAAEYYGGGDPLRSLELLWGIEKKASRGPKPTLSVEQIARAAIEVADAEGLEALSMQRVAERLGFSTMSLYRYVPSKAELIEVMLDVAGGEPPELDMATEGWRPLLERWAEGLLATYRRHPWMVRIALSGPPLGPNQIAWFEAGLRAISKTGLNQGEMISTVQLISVYVRSETRFALELAQAEQHTGVAPEAWGMAYGRLLRTVIDADRFPTLSALIASGVFEEPNGDPDEDLEFGLQRILDGIEILIRRRSAQLDQM